MKATRRQLNKITELKIKPYRGWLKSIKKSRMYFPNNNTSIDIIILMGNLLIKNTEEIKDKRLIDYGKNHIKLINRVIDICKKNSEDNGTKLIAVPFFEALINHVITGIKDSKL